MLKWFLILFLIVNYSCFAQEIDSPYNKKFSLSIRAKYFLIPGWEDLSFISYSYGAEFHLTPKFSIGIDGGAFRRNKTYDDENDVPIDGTFEKRNYMFLDLKYHFVNNTNFSFYGSIVSKQFGKYYSWSEKFDYDFPSNYNFKQYELYQRGEFVEYGAGIGTKLYIANYQAGFDFSLFVMHRRSNYRMMKLVDNEILYSASNTQQTIPFFRITFFYHFFRFKKEI